MSWDPHVASGIKNSGDVKSAAIIGKDGAVWGKYGSCPQITAQELEECSGHLAKNETCSNNFEGKKHMYINNIEGCGGYRCGPQSVAVYSANTHYGVVIGKDGVSVPACMELAQNLKQTLAGVGYQ